MNLADVVKDAQAAIDRDRLLLRKALADSPPPPGLVRPDDATFMQWVLAMREQYPPQDIQLPTGEVVKECPLLLMLALPNVAGGKEVLERIREIERKTVL